MIAFEFIASGSKGNATLLYDGETLIQVDMGISLKRLKEGLSALKKDVSDIQGVFITHEHSDHVCSLPRLRSKGVKAFSTPSTLSSPDVILKPLESLRIGTIDVLPFSSSHDASDPLNFVFTLNGKKLAYITDTGVIKAKNLPFLANCDYYLFESNHDKSMLASSSRPESLKKRIAGKHGHLSNVQAGEYLASLIGDKTKKIYLAHISEECNTPEIALETIQRIFAEKQVAFPIEDIVPLRQYSLVEGGEE